MWNQARPSPETGYRLSSGAKRSTSQSATHSEPKLRLDRKCLPKLGCDHRWRDDLPDPLGVARNDQFRAIAESYNAALLDTLDE